MFLVILMVKKFLELFTEKNCKKKGEKSLELKKWLRKKLINYMLNEVAKIILLIVGLIKKT